MKLTFKQSLSHLDSLQPAYDLLYRCIEVDHFAPKIYWNTLRERRSDLNALDYLCFSETGALIGLLNIFFFTDAPEICIMVDPQFRHQGIFKKLLQIALLKLKNYVVSYYCFIVNEKYESFIDACKARKGVFDHREVEMRPVKNNIPTPLSDLKKITVYQADIADIPLLAEIHIQSFDQPSLQAMKDRFSVTLREPHRKAYLAKNERGDAIGKLHAREDFDRILIHDVGIANAFRRQGYGRALMLTWIENYAKNYTKPIAVEVLGDNTPALELYKSCGFDFTQTYQFWRFKL